MVNPLFVPVDIAAEHFPYLSANTPSCLGPLSQQRGGARAIPQGDSMPLFFLRS
ncbi:MAG: hypothetical protein AAFY43_11185 [Pseudomonadota bacterium]